MEFPTLALLLVLAVAYLSGRLSSKLGFPSVLGELIAGIILGPPLLGWLDSVPALAILAEMGILLMMLYIGMEIDPKELKKASTGGFLAAIGGFITPFIACYFLVIAFGGTSMAGAFVGMAAGVTSLATKSRILTDLNLLDTRIAHVMLVGALIADTLSLLVFAALLGVAQSGTLEAGALGLSTLKAVLFFLGAVAVGRYALPWVGKYISKASRGPSFAVVVIITLAYAEAAHLAGMHGILGAFLAGLFLRDSVLGMSLKKEVMGLVKDASLRFLAPIFFVTAGFAVTLDVVTEQPVLLILVILVATLAKIVGTTLFYLPTKHGWREGVVLGAAMNGRGAVEIIIAQIGLSYGIISAEIFSILVLMAIATTATVPVLLTWGARWLERNNLLVRLHSERENILIIGAGPSARLLAQALSASKAKITLLDSSEERCRIATEQGLTAVRGNALDEQVLYEAGASSAGTVIALTNNNEVDILAARLAREVFQIPTVLLASNTRREAKNDPALGSISANELIFGAKQLAEWNLLAEYGNVSLVNQTIERDGSALEISKGLASTRSVLPLTKISNGTVEPIQVTTRFLPGDTMVYAVHHAASAPQNAQLEAFRSAPMLDLDKPMNFSEFMDVTAGVLSQNLGLPTAEIKYRFVHGEHVSGTIIEQGIAVPHIRVNHSDTFELCLVRCKGGITFPGDTHPVHAAFVIASSDSRRTDHLRMLATIARLVSNDSFLVKWNTSSDLERLRSELLERITPLTPKL